MKTLIMLAAWIVFAVPLPLMAEEKTASTGSAGGQAPAGDAAKKPSEWDISVYPIYAWAPLFGADVTTPTFPDQPGGTTPPTGSASGSFDGAALAGFRIQKGHWSAASNILWAKVSADQTDPKVHIGLNVVFGQMMGGREVLPNLFVEGGVRRMALKISAQVTTYPEVNTKPGVWDPLVGVTYRRDLGKKWRLYAHIDGGGFGVGSDVTMAGTGVAEWRFAKHFGMVFGYSALHFKIGEPVPNQPSTKPVSDRTLFVDQTMHGPVLGFGIYF